MSIADADVVRKRDRVEQWLEDGTTSFLGIAALRHGFASIDRLQSPNINMYDRLDIISVTETEDCNI
jgi:molybdenum cofactor sulfurtransferase